MELDMTTLNKDLFGKTSNSPIGGKDATIFKGLLKLIEDKQFKKALKNVNKLLKKYEDHGECLALKGIITRSLHPDLKDESYDLVKKGIAKDLNSYVCWHVYGLLLKADRLYSQALPAFRRARKTDNKSTALLREIANLEIQVRDYANYAETRRQLLVLKPSNRQYWMGYLLGQYLNKDYAGVLNLIDSFEKATGQHREEYEKSELHLFRNLVLEKMGDVEGAVKHSYQAEPFIVDKVALKERRARMLLSLGRAAEAQHEYRQLLAINQEDAAYYDGLRQAVSAEYRAATSTSEAGSEGEIRELLKIFDQLGITYPRATSPRRLPMDFLETSVPWQREELKKRLDNFIRPQLRRGKPALYKELKGLYRDPGKVQVIEEIVTGFLDSLRKEKRLPGETKPEAPGTLLFVLYYLSQHFARTDPAKALSLVNEAIAHTPTLINLYTVQGSIYKRAGDFLRASLIVDYARNLDLADRYLNTKSVLYHLRAGNLVQADRVVGLFTKEKDRPTHNLFEMQASWYELELAEGLFRKKEYEEALKQFKNVEKHFEDFTEDQYDFHVYCQRKVTLRAYLDLLKWEDELKKHRFYVRMCKGMIRVLLAMDNVPEANKYVQELQNGREQEPGIEREELAFQVYVRRKKWLQALREVVRAKAKARDESERAQVHRMAVLLFAHVENPEERSKIHEVSLSVLTRSQVSLPEDKPLDQINQSVLTEATANVYVWQKAVGQVAIEAFKDKKRGLELLHGVEKATGVTISDCLQVVEFIGHHFGEASEEERAYREACKRKFPLSTVFVPDPPEEPKGEEEKGEKGQDAKPANKAT